MKEDAKFNDPSFNICGYTTNEMQYYPITGKLFDSNVLPFCQFSIIQSHIYTLQRPGPGYTCTDVAVVFGLILVISIKYTVICISLHAEMNRATYHMGEDIVKEYADHPAPSCPSQQAGNEQSTGYTHTVCPACQYEVK